MFCVRSGDLSELGEVFLPAGTGLVVFDRFLVLQLPKPKPLLCPLATLLT